MCQWSLFQSDIQSMTFPPEFNCSPWYMSDIVRYLVIHPLIHTTVHLVYINTLVTHCDQQQLSNVSMFAGRDHCYTIQCVTCFNRHLEWFKYTPAASISFKHVSKPVKTRCFTISCIPPSNRTFANPFSVRPNVLLMTKGILKEAYK